MTEPRHKIGDVREDGHVFYKYDNGTPKWYSPKAYHRYRVNLSLQNAKVRAQRRGLPIDITTDYLLSIFPKDSKCPVLGVSLSWGQSTGRGTSPSLDRIVPALGYVRGNVVFVSDYVNRIKSDASISNLEKIVTFYKSLGAAK